MLILILSFFVAAVVTLLIVRSAKQHAHLSHDHDISGPQKFHATPVPRIGGLGIVAGIVAAGIAMSWMAPAAARILWPLLLCAVPTFASGLAEDITKRVSPSRRLVFTAVSAFFALIWINASIGRIGTPMLDAFVALPLVAPVLTIFVVVGVTNAVNIIDGFNGLASMCVVLMLVATGYVAFQVDDRAILVIALGSVGAILGFFVWNFPAGLVFLGDGGAYLLGFLVCELSLLLMQRNPTVSPMFPLLACIYPIFETLFSIYRKRFIRKMSPGVPDGVHLHMLVYKRLMRWVVGRADAKALTHRNSLTSPYLWFLCMASIVPAVLFWDNTLVLLGFILLFGVTYVTLYWRIVRFRVPKWMVARW